MSELIVAVADSPFPSMDPVEKAIATVWRAVADVGQRGGRGHSRCGPRRRRVMVCYAKMPSDLIRQLAVAK